MVSFAIRYVAPALVIPIIVFILTYEYLGMGDFLGIAASYVTAVMPAIALIIYFAKKGYETNEERKMASKNLFGELNDALVALEYTPNDLIDLPVHNQHFTYTNRFLNHDIYDGLVHSGKISFLKFELQQQIQDIMKMIKEHNYYLRYISKLGDKYGVASKLTSKYYLYIETIELQLIKKIPKMMKELQKEFKFIHSNQNLE